MQTVSELYSAIWRDTGHRKEHRAIIAGVTYDEDNIVGAPVVSRALYDEYSGFVGNCIAGQVSLSIIPQGDIPRMAEIRLETRLALDKMTCSAKSFGELIPYGPTKLISPDGTVYYFDIPVHGASPGSELLSHEIVITWSSVSGISGKSVAEWTDFDHEYDLSFYDSDPGDAKELPGLSGWSASEEVDHSEWLPKGTFYIDTRKLDPESGVLTIHGYDAMLKADHDFVQSGDILAVTGEYSCSLEVEGKIQSRVYMITAPDGKNWYFRQPLHLGLGSFVRHKDVFFWNPIDGMSGEEFIVHIRDGVQVEWHGYLSLKDTPIDGAVVLEGLSAWAPTGNPDYEWPVASSVVVRQISKRMGISVDARTQLSGTVRVPYGVETGRELLGYIAAANCGNWIVTDAGQLRLVPLWSIPENAETSYLIDEDGNAITLGGVRILV